MTIVTGSSALVTELVEVLGLPGNLIRFELKASYNAPVEVMCEFYPDIKKPSEIIRKKYTLVDADE